MTRWCRRLRICTSQIGCDTTRRLGNGRRSMLS
ncbi:ubiquitin-conjugating enzyme subfamily protein, partial [Toxoplasma gondii TgCatPRC2]